MPTMKFKVSPSVPQHIARARAALKGGAALKGVRSLMRALELFDPKRVIGKAKYETGIFIMEVVGELNHSAKVREFLSRVCFFSDIPYVPGQEDRLYAILRVLENALQEDAAAVELDLAGNRDERRNQLWNKGSDLLDKGEAARGKSVLRRLAEEFGDEPGVKARIGEALIKAELAPEALEFLEDAVGRYPNDHKSYGFLVRAYTELREFEKAEKVYIAALKRFGQHHKTLINFANLYKMWNKRDQAYYIAKMALHEAPGNKEAQAIMDWADHRR